MRPARTLAALCAALIMAISLPAVALGQSAGDEQYQDPLGGGGSGSGSDSGSGSGGGGGSSDSGNVNAAQAEDDTEAAQAEELPRTGYDILIPAYTGLALLLVGTVVFRLTRPLS